MANEFQERWSYDSNGRLEYHGQAEPGAHESEEKWMIKKYSYSGINDATKKYPNGSNANVFAWSNKANYRYR